MNPKPYHLQITAKTQFFNFFRSFFILMGIDKLLSTFTRHSSMNSLEPAQMVLFRLIKPDYKIINAATEKPVHPDGVNHFPKFI